MIFDVAHGECLCHDRHRSGFYKVARQTVHRCMAHALSNWHLYVVALTLNRLLFAIAILDVPQESFMSTSVAVYNLINK